MPRAIVCGLVLCGCKVENPAFFAGTTGDVDASTGAALTTSPTSAGPTADPTATSASETAAQTGTTTDALATTAGVETDTGPVTDATSGPPPPECAAITDPLAPRVLLRGAEDQPIETAMCQKWAGEQPFIAGIVTPTGGENGFTVLPTDACKLADVGHTKLAFGPGLPLPGFPADQLCGEVRFGVHPDFQECTPAWVMVSKIGEPGAVMLFGRFGAPESALPQDFPALSIGLVPESPCGCADCCPATPGAPGVYALAAGEQTLSEGASVSIAVDGAVYQLQNIRSHAHPECEDPGALAPTWQHVDWIAVRESE